jgi:hypothetical protein
MAISFPTVWVKQLSMDASEHRTPGPIRKHQKIVKMIAQTIGIMSAMAENTVAAVDRPGDDVGCAKPACAFDLQHFHHRTVHAIYGEIFHDPGDPMGFHG